MRVDEKAFVAEVRSLAAANPDYVYEPPVKETAECRYVHEGVGSCIVGRALIACGVPVNELAEHEGDGAVHVLPQFGICTEVAYWADEVQGQQDAKTSWGEAVAEANGRYSFVVDGA